MLALKPDIHVKVLYTWQDGTKAIQDPGFGKQITWDVPLTEGYDLQLVSPSTEVVNRTFRNMDSPGLISAVEAFAPTAVMVIGWNFRSHLRAMRHFHGRVPVLFRGDSTLLDRQPKAKKILRTILLKWVLSHVDFALSVGTNNDAYFRHHGLADDQIITARHCIDNDRFAGQGTNFDVQANQLRQELGFSDAQTVLLYVGKFEHKKRPDRLVALFLRAIQKQPDLRLLMVGDGAMGASLKSQADGCDAIRFLPFQNQDRIPVIYRTGDITILPSDYNETWGLALNESMACGRTVIATPQVGSVVDLIVEGQTGFVLPPSWTGLESAVKLLHELPSRDTLLKMGSHCQRFIQRWSFENLVNAIITLLADLPQQSRTGLK